MDIKGFFWLLVTWLGLWLVSFIFRLGIGASGLFLLLGIAILLRFLGRRFIAIFIPERRMRSYALGMLGGFIGGLGFRALGFGPELAGVNLIGAFLGAGLAILLWGLYPFLQILFRKPLR